MIQELHKYIGFSVMNVPCKDCITLAMCKAKMLENHKNGSGIFSGLTHKCSIMYNFIFYQVKNETNEWDDDLAIPSYTVHIRKENVLAIIRYVLGAKIEKHYRNDPPF